ncbi:MAG: 30S ribosomal protein S6 [Phycisphaerales bacterium]|nr:30S ribosomal protein S6 [Phycisphaerales bacterium]
MSETRICTYEGLFLFPQAATADLKAALDHVSDILNRAGAEVISMSKWDERKLAYDIEGNKRGVFFLTYFKCDTKNIVSIERDTRLSERLLRALVTRAEHVLPEEMAANEGRQKLSDEIVLRGTEAAAAAAAAATAAAAAAATAAATAAANASAVASAAAASTAG